MKISRNKLEEMYRSKLDREICLQLKITPPTLRRLLRKAGIQLKGSGNRVPRNKIVLI
jgi:phage antirepressor YoqD-like protein